LIPLPLGSWEASLAFELLPHNGEDLLVASNSGSSLLRLISDPVHGGFWQCAKIIDVLFDELLLFQVVLKLLLQGEHLECFLHVLEVSWHPSEVRLACLGHLSVDHRVAQG
jgi:hypothetical protein